MELSEVIKKLNDDVLELLDKNYLFNNLEETAVKSGWLGYPPTTLKAITERELQLGIVFPESYKKFLLLSNGFRHISPFIENLYSIEKIDWVRNSEDDEWWLNLIESDPIEMSDSEYLNYNKSQSSVWFRPEYFRHSLKISDWGDACCLFLNPKIIHEGEWEVLFYATWFPGTRRYVSFKEYLIETHENNLYLLTSEDKNRS